MVEGVRFRPPTVDVPPEVDWVIQRAFGKPDLRANAETLRQSKAVSVMNELGLMRRARSRTQPSRLENEIGVEGLGECDKAIFGAVALARRDEEVARHLAALAGQLGLPLVFLKGMALQLQDRIKPGSRLAADVDVLVASEEAERLQNGLIAQGAVATDFPEHQHLVPLAHPLGSVVEIHRRIPGVRLTGELDATAEGLLEAKLVTPMPEIGPAVFVPNDGILLAHLFAHAVGQHGSAPEAYPIFMLLADLQDLDWNQAASSRFLDQEFRWIQQAVSREEIQGVTDLLARLEQGKIASEIVSLDDGAGVLLRHMLAGVFDPDYRQALKLGRQFKGPIGDGGVSTSVRNLREALFLTDDQIDIVYGKPDSRLGYLGWRAWRPFDLALRSAKSLWAWVRLSRRK